MNIHTAHPAQFGIPIVSWLLARRVQRPHNVAQRTSSLFADLRLASKEVRAIKASVGVTVECLSGRVWITQDGDPRDVVLDPQETFIVDRDSRTLIMALEGALVRCHPFQLN
jgi:Protein of unknown function (DUF2917)